MEREAVGQQRERRDGAQETDLSAILERKEQELSSVGERKREAAARRSRELEEKLRAKDNEVSSLKQQMAQLADDFKYNLSLLEDRDAELERFEKTVEDLKAKLSSEQEKSANLNSRAEEAERLCKEKGEELKSLRASLPSQAHTDSAKALQGPPEDPLNPQESAQHSRAETLSKETEHLNSTLNRLANENENLRASMRASEAERKATMAEMEARLSSKDSRIAELEDRLNSSAPRQARPVGRTPAASTSSVGIQASEIGGAQPGEGEGSLDAEELKKELSAAYEELGRAYAQLYTAGKLDGSGSSAKPKALPPPEEPPKSKSKGQGACKSHRCRQQSRRRCERQHHLSELRRNEPKGPAREEKAGRRHKGGKPADIELSSLRQRLERLENGRKVGR